MHVAFIKIPGGWANADLETEEFHAKTKTGAVVHGDMKRMRNYVFHKKLFALFNLAYEYWEPQEIDTKWGKPVKSFDTFRKNLTILAGYGHLVFNIDGTYKMEADSISFGSMSQETFDELYQSVITVVMERIPVLKDMDEDAIRDLVEKVIGFA